MAKRINDENVSEEIRKVKSEITDDSDKFIDAEAGKFLLLLEKTFNEHHEKKLKEENTENNTNSQQLTKYLRLTLVFMRNSAQREKFNFCFSRVFC